MTYRRVLTDNGLIIRNENGDAVAGPFESNPPRDEDQLEDLFDDAEIDDKTKSAIKILIGIGTTIDERGLSE